MFIRGMMGLLLKLHILQGVPENAGYFRPGVAGNGLHRAEEVNPAPHGLKRIGLNR
jgi:hypothetical protein